MNKAEMEKAILDRLTELRNDSREHDEIERDWRSRQTEEYKDANPAFYFNDYIYSQDARNAICNIVFNHFECIHHCRNHRHGSYDEYVATTQETDAITAILKGMKKKGLIQPSKSGMMIKVLF